MRVHFLHRNVQDNVVILEEGNLPHPRCPQCDMLVPCHALKGRHLATTQCSRGADRKIRRLSEKELREISERYFQAYVQPLENITAFRYLGRLMMTGDDDCTAVVGNLHNARKSWGQLLRILIQEGVNPKVSGHFFKAVTQEVLLFGAETWVMTPIS